MKNLFNVLRSAYFQLTIILLSFFYITAIHVWQYKADFYSEEVQPVLPISEKTRRLASNIDVGLHINNFPQFSFNKNNFVMDAVVWFRFPIGTENISNVENFGFQNGEIEQKSEAIVKLIGDEVVVSYQVRVRFKTYLDYRYFPVGDHRLTIMVHNRTVTPNETVFRAAEENFELSNNILVSTWLPVNKGVQAGFLRSALNKSNDALQISYPVAVFTIDFQNNSARDLITLYFPLFVMFFIGFFSLMVDLTDNSRLNMIATSMPILVLYRIVIDAISPPVATMTKVDFVYLLLVFLSLVLLMFQAYVVLSVRRKKKLDATHLAVHVEHLDMLNSIVFIVIIVSLLSFLTYNGLW